jgi:hypothetical protein
MERRQICALGCHDAGPARPSEIEQQVLWSASEGAGNAAPHLSSIFAISVFRVAFAECRFSKAGEMRLGALIHCERSFKAGLKAVSAAGPA